MMQKTNELYVGLKCNCFYKGEVHECEVLDYTSMRAYIKCYISLLDVTVNVPKTLVNWPYSPELEEKWLDDYDAKKDRRERLREAREESRSSAKERINRRKPSRSGYGTVITTGPEARLVADAIKNRLNTFCGVGSRAVANLLSTLYRRGDRVAILYHLALEMERENLNIFNEKRISFGCHFMAKRRKLYLELVKSCQTLEIPIGYSKEDRGVVCILLPGCETIGIPVKEWGIDIVGLSTFVHPWDGNCRKNIRRIESAISSRYGEILKKKYPDRLKENGEQNPVISC